MTHNHSRNHVFVQDKDLDSCKLFEAADPLLVLRRHDTEYHSDVNGLCLDQREDHFERRLVAGIERTEKETSGHSSDHSRIFHLSSEDALEGNEDQFVEVRFNTPQSHQSSVLRLIESKSAAEPTAKVDASPESEGDGEDEVSWFFERETEFSEYSLEQHRLDCERLSTDFHGGSGLDNLHDSDKVDHDFINTEEFTVRKDSALAVNNGKDKQNYLHNFPKETDSGKPEDEFDDEFDSCFPLEEQNSIPKFPTEVASKKPGEVEIDDEFDSCFPVEEQNSIPKFSTDVASRKPDDVEIDDEFDSCFPVEEQNSIPKFPPEVASRKPDEVEIDDEFDSCFPVEEQNSIPKFSTDVASRKPDDVEIDDEFDSCFPLEEHTVVPKMSSGKAIEYEIDDEFDSCFPMEESDAIQKIPKENTKDSRGEQFDSRFPLGKTNANGKILKEKTKDSIVFKAEFNQDKINEQDETFKRVEVDMTKCNSTIYTREIRNSSAIGKSIQKLLRSKWDKTAPRRKSGIQNNSRHFRSVETVINHHVSGGQDTTSCHSNASALKSVEIKDNSPLESETVTSERQGNLNLTDHLKNLATIKPQNFKPDKAFETISSQGSKTQEAIGNLLKARQRNTAERRLANMQNNSRHFRPNKLTTNHFILEDMNLTSGQDVDSEMTSPLSLSPGVTEPRNISDGIRNKSRHLLNEESLQAMPFSCKEDVRFSTNKQETQNPYRMKEHDILQLG